MYTPSTTRIMTFTHTWTVSDAFKQPEAARPTRRSIEESLDSKVTDAEAACNEVDSDDE